MLQGTLLIQGMTECARHIVSLLLPDPPNLAQLDLHAPVSHLTAQLLIVATRVQGKDGVNKDEAELNQEERKQRRATKKRIAKRKTDEKEEKAGVSSNAKGIKSAREDAQAVKDAKASKKRQRTEKYASSTSGSVFKKLQEEQAAGGFSAVKAAQAKKAADAADGKSAHLKM